MSSGVSRRLDAISDSVTLAITARAAAMRAQGEPVIGFGAGEPDFPTPEHIVDAAQRAAADPLMHHYSPARGLPALREAVVMKTKRDSGLEVQPDEVTITHGAKGALFGACMALLDDGDEVLLPSPYWVSYPEMVRLAGGVPRVVETSMDRGFKASVEDLDAACTSRTKALIFVSPSNPTGAVYGREEVAEIGRWAAERGIWVLTDEIYEHLVYGRARFSSLPVEAPEVRSQCVVVNGVAKTYAMTGWRVGWVIAPPEIAAAVGRLQSHSTSNVPNVAQMAALAALDGPMDSSIEMRAVFERRLDTMMELLSKVPGARTVRPDGAFYVFPNVEECLGPGVTTSVELAATLLEDAQIAVVPGDPFGAPGHVRLSFALADADLVTGLTRWIEASG